MTLLLFLSPFVSFVLSATAVWFLSRNESFFYIPDVPNDRSLHARVVSRAGGLGIFGATLSVLMALGVLGGIDLAAIAMVAAVFPVLLISFLDDKWNLPAFVRFLVHVVAAVILVHGIDLQILTVLPGVQLEIPWLVGMIAVLTAIWYTNLYNFMDGMDGLAGGMAVFGFGMLSVLGLLNGAIPFAMLFGVVAASSAGFLVWNFPPARIFMGDVGSSGLGFLAAVGALWGDSAGIVPFWKSMLVFSPFLADATATLIRRLLAGERVWDAHKSHFYQKAVQGGFSHSHVTLMEYAVMAAIVVTVGFLELAESNVLDWLACTFWSLVYGAIGLQINRVYSSHCKQHRGSPRVD